MKIWISLLTLILVVGFSHAAFAMDDTIENREAQALRYLNTTPPKEMMADMVEQMSANLPQESQKAFKDLMLKYFDMKVLTTLTLKAMIKNFTADELSAMADFYGSPPGKSSVKKLGSYLADIMPGIQNELRKAQVRAFEELSANKEKDVDKEIDVKKE